MRKRLQYPSVSKAFVYPVAAVTVMVGPFSAFSQPVQPKPQQPQGVINTPVRAAVPPLVQFCSFQPNFQTPKSPTLAGVVNAPYIQSPSVFQFFGWANFTQQFKAKPPIIHLFSEFRPAPNEFPPDRRDGVYVKKKRKLNTREKDPYKEEAEIKRKRREAILDAWYGPPVSYSLPELVLPPQPKPLPNLGDLPQLIAQLQQQQAMDAKTKAERDEEEDVFNILKDIL